MKINVGGTERDVRILFSEDKIRSRIIAIAKEINAVPPQMAPRWSCSLFFMEL